jgi:hypothetical protein
MQSINEIKDYLKSEIERLEHRRDESMMSFQERVSIDGSLMALRKLDGMIK